MWFSLITSWHITSYIVHSTLFRASGIFRWIDKEECMQGWVWQCWRWYMSFCVIARMMEPIGRYGSYEVCMLMLKHQMVTALQSAAKVYMSSISMAFFISECKGGFARTSGISFSVRDQNDYAITAFSCRSRGRYLGPAKPFVRPRSMVAHLARVGPAGSWIATALGNETMLKRQ